MLSSKKISQLAILVSACMSTTLWAKPINLYDQPKPDAKVVGSLDSSSSLVPIISSKDGSWMKVGDPENGNVGWIKVSDVTTNGANTSSSGFTMTQKTINSSNGPNTVRTIQFGAPPTVTPDQNPVRADEIYQRQVEIQKATTQLIQHLFDTMNTAYQANPEFYNNLHYPMIVPVMVVPAPAPQLAPKPPAPAKPH